MIKHNHFCDLFWLTNQLLAPAAWGRRVLLQVPHCGCSAREWTNTGTELSSMATEDVSSLTEGIFVFFIQ